MSNHDEDRSVFNGCYEVAVLIERPLEQVWGQYLDVGSWVVSHTIEEVGGQSRALGAITRVSPKNVKDMAVPEPHYHYCKIIKLIPAEQYVLKTYSERGGSYGLQMTCFDDTRFARVGPHTRVTFNIYVEMKGEMIAQNPTAMTLDASRDNMLRNLNNLKRIVEGR